MQANGDALPSWLSYDGGTYTLSGTPAEGDAEELKVVLISTDSSGTFTEVITIDVVSSSQTSVVDTHQHYDWRGVDDPAGVISSKELSNNVTDWEGKFEWNSIQDVAFGQPPDVEENFEDLSWSGATRFDWTDIEDPNSTYQTADLNGITEFSSQFAWKDIVEADFGELAENILEENFDDESWSGFTRVDWTGVTDPATVAVTAEIQGVWTGIHDWRNNPTADFASDKIVVSEGFEDPTWSGLTRFDWATVEDPVSLASSYGLSGLWEGKFLWAGKPEPTFSEKSLKLEEDFDDDWTI